MRTNGRAEALPVASDPHERTASASFTAVLNTSPPKKLKLGSHAEWLRSIGITTAPTKTPQPPRRTEISSQQEQHQRSVHTAYRCVSNSVPQTSAESRSEARAPNTVLPVLGGYRRAKGRTFVQQKPPDIDAEPHTVLPSVLNKLSNHTSVQVQQRRRTRRSIRRPLIPPVPAASDDPPLSTVATVATLDVADNEEALVDGDMEANSEWSERSESDSSGASGPEDCGSEEILPSDGTSRGRSMQLVGEDQAEELSEAIAEYYVQFEVTSSRAGHHSGPIAQEAAPRSSRELRHRRKHHSPSSSPTAQASSSSDTNRTSALLQPESHGLLARKDGTSRPATRSFHQDRFEDDSIAPIPSSQSPAAYRSSSSSVIPPRNQAAFHRLLQQYLGLLQCDSSVPMSLTAVSNTVS